MKTQQSVWQRMIPKKWEDAWLERLIWAGPQNCVVTDLPGHKTAKLEVYGLSAAQLKKLTKEFGGQIVNKTNASWMASQHRAFSLPLAPWLCLASDHKSIPQKYRKLPALIIPAGLAFGTGEHATTGMCLRQLMKHLPVANGKVLDAGTGSGILALAASLRGHKVTAIDFDVDSIKVSRINAKLNSHIPSVHWLHADALKFKSPGKYNLITANLFSDLLVKVLPKFKKWLAKDGVLILSGILKEQESAILAALKKDKFVVSGRFRKGKWVCLVVGSQIKA
jgi:ribosomal protein L11 methyltransferase